MSVPSCSANCRIPPTPLRGGHQLSQVAQNSNAPTPQSHHDQTKYPWLGFDASLTPSYRRTLSAFITWGGVPLRHLANVAVHGPAEMQPALIRPQSARVLDPEPAVHSRVSVVV